MNNSIPFISKLNAYIEERQQKIQDKQSILNTLRTKLSLKNKEIADMKKQYQNLFDEKIFNNIINAEKERDQIQDSINKISDLVDLMNTGEFTYDPVVLEKEIDSYVENIGFDNLKKAIVAAKNNYLNAIKIYMNKLNEMNSMRTSLDGMKDNMPKEIKDCIIKTLEKHKSDFLYTDDMFIKDYDNQRMKPAANQAAINIYLNHQYGI